MNINDSKQSYTGLFIEGELPENEKSIIKYENGDVFSGFVKDF